MRVELPALRPNGHAAVEGPVYTMTGMCQNPSFRLSFGAGRERDFGRVFLGAAAFGAGAAAAAEGDAAGDPYLLLRRSFDGGAAVVVVRIEWEGVFTLLANDDGAAQAVFDELLAPADPEEVQRQWRDDGATREQFRQWLLAE
ncbi:MAG TPA: hypothetical protein VFP94_08660 [Terriglobales bacterium]|nr:hypothetical protein [Terriglobales bacterium]